MWLLAIVIIFAAVITHKEELVTFWSNIPLVHLSILLQFIISFLILKVAFQLLGLDGGSASTLNDSKPSGVFSVYCCQSWLVQTWRLQAVAEVE